MRKYFFARLLSNKSDEVGNLCFSDRGIGKIFIVTPCRPEVFPDRFKCPDYIGSVGIAGVNWELLHD